MRADFALIGEARGKEAARTLGLGAIGTIGVIELANRRGLVDGPGVTAKLKATSFRGAPKLLATLVGITRDQLPK